MRNVFLDAGGVLVHPNWERVAASLRGHGVEVSAASLKSADPVARHSFDHPSFFESSDDAARSRFFFDSVLSQAGVSASEGTRRAFAELDAYHARHNLWETLGEGLPEALETLKGRCRRLAVVSNSNGTLREHLGRLGLLDYFDAVLDSKEVGFEKPDPRIFQAALEATASRPEDTVHVGDLYHVDVVGARAAGIAPILFDAAALYEGADCPRVASLKELVSFLGSAC